jgi:chromate transport protein ChrA
MSHIQTARLAFFATIAMVAILFFADLFGDTTAVKDLWMSVAAVAVIVAGYITWVLYICSNPEKVNP